FVARIEGKSGHAAEPHKSMDPVLAASSTVLALQQLISRELDPLQSQVLSVTYVRGGGALNVIPSYVELGGTLRSLTTKGMQRLQQRVKESMLEYGEQIPFDLAMYPGFSQMRAGSNLNLGLIPSAFTYFKIRDRRQGEVEEEEEDEEKEKVEGKETLQKKGI
nr:IAA-amino acid hydrolase ILR1-like 5 [Tanacetum cinerariifolium]